MGHVVRTPAGSFRANWRDDTGRQRAKSFRTKREAAGFLAQVEAALARGIYVDPHAGRQPFGPYAENWLGSRGSEKTTAARDASIMRVHVLARWGDVPIGRIDHSAVQRWVSEVAQQRSAATVRECFRLLPGVLRAAVRDRLIAVSPCEGIRLPPRRRKDTDERPITPDVVRDVLAPHVHPRYRALVLLAAGTGLRWGECVGLRWDSVDLDAGELRVVRTAVEVSGVVTVKAYPKSRAGRRTVPLVDFVAEAVVEHRELFGQGPAGEVFTNADGGPLWRGHFRSRYWRPALVRAGLLGSAEQLTGGGWVARWDDTHGIRQIAEFGTEAAAVEHVARAAGPGPRFHDLRHGFATWLVSRSVPVNVVQQVMGHENASTTLDLYTHHSRGAHDDVRATFAGGARAGRQAPSPAARSALRRPSADSLLTGQPENDETAGRGPD